MKRNFKTLFICGAVSIASLGIAAAGIFSKNNIKPVEAYTEEFDSESFRTVMSIYFDTTRPLKSVDMNFKITVKDNKSSSEVYLDGTFNKEVIPAATSGNWKKGFFALDITTDRMPGYYYIYAERITSDWIRTSPSTYIVIKTYYQGNIVFQHDCATIGKWEKTSDKTIDYCEFEGDFTPLENGEKLLRPKINKCVVNFNNELTGNPSELPISLDYVNEVEDVNLPDFSNTTFDIPGDGESDTMSYGFPEVNNDYYPSSNFAGYYSENYTQYYDDECSPASAYGVGTDNILNLDAQFKYGLNLQANGGLFDLSNIDDLTMKNLMTYATEGYYIAGTGTHLPTESEIAKDGAVFKGWYSTPNFVEGTKVESIYETDTGDKILYAKWDYIATFTINAPTPVSFEQQVAYGETVKRPEEYVSGEVIEVVDGIRYLFDNWYTDDTYTTLFTFGETLSAPVTIYGKTYTYIDKFIELYMHPEIPFDDHSEGTACKMYFPGAIAAFNTILNDEEKDLFMSSPEYVNYAERLLAWARANNYEYDYQAKNFYETSMFNIYALGNNADISLIIVLICGITFISLTAMLILKKKKHSR